MSEVRATPHTGGAPVELDLCELCNGLWIDGPELAAICPTVSDLPSRRFEIAMLGRQGGGISRCPRCEQVPYEFVVVDIPVDFCAGCTGVWLDGSEYGEIELEAAPPADASRGGPYRESAARAAETGSVKCAGCGDRVPLRSTHMWEQGLLCGGCYAAKMQRAADRRAEGGPETVGLAEGLIYLFEDLLGGRDRRQR